MSVAVAGPKGEFLYVCAYQQVKAFAKPTLTGEVALGTIATIGLAVIAVSSWLRTRVPYTAWRAIHALSFGAMFLALAHSIAAGTDTPNAVTEALYVATSVSLTGLIALRILLTTGARPRSEATPARF